MLIGTKIKIILETDNGTTIIIRIKIAKINKFKNKNNNKSNNINKRQIEY